MYSFVSLKLALHFLYVATPSPSIQHFNVCVNSYTIFFFNNFTMILSWISELSIMYKWTKKLSAMVLPQPLSSLLILFHYIIFFSWILSLLLRYILLSFFVIVVIGVVYGYTDGEFFPTRFHFISYNYRAVKKLFYL